MSSAMLEWSQPYPNNRVFQMVIPLTYGQQDFYGLLHWFVRTCPLAADFFIQNSRNSWDFRPKSHTRFAVTFSLGLFQDEAIVDLIFHQQDETQADAAFRLSLASILTLWVGAANEFRTLFWWAATWNAALHVLRTTRTASVGSLALSISLESDPTTHWISKEFEVSPTGKLPRFVTCAMHLIRIHRHMVFGPCEFQKLVRELSMELSSSDLHVFARQRLRNALSLIHC